MSNPLIVLGWMMSDSKQDQITSSIPLPHPRMNGQVRVKNGKFFSKEIT